MVSILPYSSVSVPGAISSWSCSMTGGAKKWMPELKLEAAVPGPTENWMPDPTLDGVAHARAVKWIPERKLDAAEEFLARGARLAVSGEAAASGLFATHLPPEVCWGE